MELVDVVLYMVSEKSGKRRQEGVSMRRGGRCRGISQVSRAEFERGENIMDSWIRAPAAVNGSFEASVLRSHFLWQRWGGQMVGFDQIMRAFL